MKLVEACLPLALLATNALAQATAQPWAQCGGINFVGPTSEYATGA